MEITFEELKELHEILSKLSSKEILKLLNEIAKAPEERHKKLQESFSYVVMNPKTYEQWDGKTNKEVIEYNSIKSVISKLNSKRRL